MDVYCEKMVFSYISHLQNSTIITGSIHLEVPPLKTHFEMKPVAPFRLDLTAWTLRRRPENIVDIWKDERYSRVLLIRDRPVLVEVAQTGPADSPVLAVTASCPPALKEPVAAALKWILSTQVDLTPFYRLADRHPEIKSLAERFRGVKPPRFSSLFEALVNGIACQQLSLAVGITLLNRLAIHYGPALGERRALPRPADLAEVKESALLKLGFSRSKSRSLIGVSTQIARKVFNPDELFHLEDPTEIHDRLDALPGVGPWTAQYAMLRGMGALSVFPGKDVGARRNISRFIRSGHPVSDEEISRLMKKWHPFAGMIYFHLLLSSLAERGWIGQV